MDEALQVVIEMTESIGHGFRKDLEGVSARSMWSRWNSSGIKPTFLKAVSG